MTRTASQKARRAAARAASVVAPKATQGRRSGGKTRRDEYAGLDDPVLPPRGSMPVPPTGRDREAGRDYYMPPDPGGPYVPPVPEPTLAEQRRRAVIRDSVKGASRDARELRAFDGFAGGQTEARRVAAAQYLQQLVDPDSPEYNVGVPDGMGSSSVVTTSYQLLTARTVVQTTVGATWTGIVILPGVKDWDGVNSYTASAFEITAVAADGTITWGRLPWSNDVMASIVADSSAWRPVTHNARLLDDSANMIQGGFALVGTFAIGSSVSLGTIGLPTNINTVFGDPEAYQRVALKDSGRLHEVAVGWMPTGQDNGFASLVAGGTGFLPPSTIPAWSGESAIVYLAHLPTSAAAATEYTVRSWAVKRVVEWIPAAVPGELAGEDSQIPVDAQQELNDLRMYVRGKTGLAFTNSQVSKSGAFLSDAWRNAARLVANIAQTASTALVTGTRFAGTVAAVAGAVASLGARVGSSSRVPRVLARATPRQKAMHYQAVSRGLTSPLVARFWADKVGQPIFHQESALRARECLTRLRARGVPAAARSTGGATVTIGANAETVRDDMSVGTCDDADWEGYDPFDPQVNP